MRAVLLCAILFCSPLTIALYAQDISPEILRMHQEEIDQELAQLQQDEAESHIRADKTTYNENRQTAAQRRYLSLRQKFDSRHVHASWQTNGE